MRLSAPRVPPLERADWNEKQAEVMQRFGEGDIANVFKTMINHPDLFRRWVVFANHILGKSTISVRDREILILRIAYIVRSEYEWAQHVLIARREGLSEDEIKMTQTGPDTHDLATTDRLLLQATDELKDDTFISDETWSGLSEHYSTEQIMDIIFTVGQYNMLAMGLNSMGVQLDAGLPAGFEL